MKKKMIIGIAALLSNFVGQLFGQNVLELPLQQGEKVWAGVVREGEMAPYDAGYSIDFYGDNKANQMQPLMLTSAGQYVWSENPFRFEIQTDKIRLIDPYGTLTTGKAGKTLAEAQRYVSQRFFKASGFLPDTLFFTAPQYNTWIELNYHQNQADVLKYAHAIIDNGLPAGVFMIDDTWQEDYGVWDFHPGRFPQPKAMIDELHGLGFKVMVWICPFVSADQKLLWYELKGKKAFLQEKKTAADTYETVDNPIMIPWWNGVSAELDLSSSEAVDWLNRQLDRLVADYGIDGFKFDAADFGFYPNNSLSKGNITPNEQSERYARIGLRFPFNEYRACWKMGGQPLVQRLQDKAHSWEDLRVLIPQIIVQGLVGYTFCCPDMIGGGWLSTFENDANIDQDLIVRSAQCSALLPMMQFSVAPWRILDATHFAAVQQAVALRTRFAPLILQLAHTSAQTGEPIVKNMEFVFPHCGYEKITDQFMLGDSILVAPMLDSGTVRQVVLPAGKWRSDDGKIYKGGKTYTITVPLNRLPYFVLV